MSKKKIDYKKYNITFKSTDKGSYKITSSTLDKLYKESSKVDKKSLLIISIPKNEKENFILEAEIKVRKNR